MCIAHVSLYWQYDPEYPLGHAQWAEEEAKRHIPPFWQVGEHVTAKWKRWTHCILCDPMVVCMHTHGCTYLCTGSRIQ